MKRRLSPFIVLLATVAITKSQPTISKTGVDLDDYCDISSKQFSAFSAEIETMKGRIGTTEDRMLEVANGTYSAISLKMCSNHTNSTQPNVT